MEHLDQVIKSVTLIAQPEIEKATFLLTEVRDRGNSVWIVGNGGSAATASHFANDLCKMGGVKAFSLPDMTSLVSAHANDDGHGAMFSEPLKRMLNTNDVLVAISCSGNSENVVNAAQFAMSIGCVVIAMTGNRPSRLSLLKPDVLIQAMAEHITVQEDIHMIACHAIARGIR